MAIPFACPGCATPFNVTDQMAGKRAKCPNCAMVFTLPAPAPAVQDAVSATAAPSVPTLPDDLFGSDRDEPERKRPRRSRRDEERDDDVDDPRPQRTKKKASSNAALIWGLVIGGIGLVLFIGCAGIIGVMVLVARNAAPPPARPMAGNMPPAGNAPANNPPAGNGPVVNAAVSPRGTNLPVGSPAKGIRVVGFNGLFQINSRLDQTDPTFENAGRIPVNGNKRCKEYVIDLTAGRHYIIDLQSGMFDAYLVLETLQGKELARNDDANPPALDAQIRFTPAQTGTYVIVATSLVGGGGNFRLTVRESQLP